MAAFKFLSSFPPVMPKKSSKKQPVDTAFARARQLIDAGDSATAERLLKEIIAQDREHAGAYHYLGRIARAAGYQAHATPLLQEAVRLQPDNADFVGYFANHLVQSGSPSQALGVVSDGLARLPGSEALQELKSALQAGGPVAKAAGSIEELRQLASAERYAELKQRSQHALTQDDANLSARYYYALALSNLGALDEAIQQFNLVVNLDPHHDEAWGQLGVVYMEKSMAAASLAAHEKALLVNPAEAVHHINAGVACMEFGHVMQAERHARQALSLKGDAVAAIVLLGRIAARSGHYEKARQLLKKALGINPGHKPAMTALTEVLLAEGELQQAEWECRRLILMDKSMIGAYNTLVDALMGQQKIDQALEFAKTGSQQRPDDLSIKNRLGICYQNAKCFAEAIGIYRSILESSPDYFSAQLNLAGISSLTGVYDQSMHYYDSALASPLASSEHHSNWIFAHLYNPEVTAQELLDITRGWATKFHSDTPRYTSWTVARDSEAPLRLGIVSGDMRDHPVGFFLESVLGKLAAMGVELYLYSTVVVQDDTSKRFARMADKWDLCYRDTPEQLAAKIHGDAVNVLLDVSGHTSHNRMGTFARKPAPVQITWLGYLSTTGLDAIDYIIGDPWVTPPDEQAHFVEKPLVLPHSYQCLSQPQGSPDVSTLPAAENSYITFGSFNNFAKLNRKVIELWAEVLKSVEGARLLLKNQVLTDPVYRDKLLGDFVALGVEEERLMFEASRSREHILESYGRVDIGLDPFPYTGCTTSFESLWMGVPVLTRRGERFLSHAGESIMNNLGMPDWIAEDAEDYVRVATEKAADTKSLAATRAGLRDRLIASPLMDADAFAQQFHEAVQGVWKQWRSENLTVAVER